MTARLQLEVLADPHHPSLPGHFPGHPLVPGVVLLDWVIQALDEHHGAHNEPGVWQIDQAKFLSPVAPGDLMSLRLSQKSEARYQFELVREQTLLASGSMTWVAA